MSISECYPAPNEPKFEKGDSEDKESIKDREAKKEVEKFEGFAIKIQEYSGITSPVDKLFISRGDCPSGPGCGPLMKRRDMIIASIEVFEASSDFAVAHEMAHEILGKTINALPNTSEHVKASITEGFCDLAAIEAISSGYNEYSEANVQDGARFYDHIVSEEDIRRFLDLSLATELGEIPTLQHNLGRRFCFLVRERYSSAPLRDVFGQILSNPPTKVEIAYPDRYMDRVGELRRTEATEVKKVTVVLGRERLI